MARYFAELMLGQTKPFVFKDSLLGATFDTLEKLATKYFDKKIPVFFSNEDMDALVGFINKTKASGEWDLPSQEEFYRLVYILIEAVRAECDNSFVFNPDFINVRASLSPSASMALLSDEMRFVRAVFDKAKAEVNVDVVTQYVKDASNLDSKIAQIESAERRVSELGKKLDEQEVGYILWVYMKPFMGFGSKKAKNCIGKEYGFLLLAA